MAFSVESAHADWASTLMQPSSTLALQTTQGQADQVSGTVKKIVITGLKNVSREAVLAAMKTREGQAYAAASATEDHDAVYAMGFFRAVDIRAKQLDTSSVEVDVNVDEFPKIKEIQVVGNKAISTQEILAAISLKPGSVFNLNTQRPNADAVRQLYIKKGFFGLVDDISPDKDQPATLRISIVEYVVGKVDVKGNVRTSAGVIKKLIKTRPGQPFSTHRWEQDLRRMVGTNWFETVRSEEDDTSELGKVNLTALVKETRTGQFGVGVQVDPRSNFAGFIRLSDANFKGSGKSVGIDFLQAAQGRGPSIDLNYGDPLFGDGDSSLGLSVYSRLVYRFTGTSFGGTSTPTEDNQYTERHTGATITYGRNIRDDLTFSTGIRAERILTNGINSNISTGFIKQDGDIGSVSFALVQNRRDVDVDPAKGTWARISFEPGISHITQIGGDVADPNLLGQKSFLKMSAEVRAYWSPQKPRTRNELDEARRVVAFRARYGSISGTIPFFEQFFAGGSDSLRGYQEDRYWGRQMLLTTLEYRHPLQKSFSVIGFMDYGGAWGGYGSLNDFTQSNKLTLHRGTGVGVSFRSPLGPIRLDVGWDEHGKSRTHFLIGTSF